METSIGVPGFGSGTRTTRDSGKTGARYVDLDDLDSSATVSGLCGIRIRSGTNEERATIWPP